MALEVPVVDAIRWTVEARDPGLDAFYVGSAAVALQMHEAGLGDAMARSLSVKDVDSLWSRSAFADLVANAAVQTGLKEFQLQWPDGAGATARHANMIPDAAHAHHLRYTAADGTMGIPGLTQIDYEALAERPQDLVTAYDVPCLPIAEILALKAILGRRKDIGQVKGLLAACASAGLVSGDDHDRVSGELEESMRERARHPSRYYARIPVSHDQS